MKRHGNLFDKIISKENLLLAFKKAKRNGKSHYKAVKRMEENLDEYIDKLHNDLKSGNYHTSGYKVRKIYDPKERDIHILPFYPDRVVQHAIMNVVHDIWNNLMYYHSYSCRKDKGMHAGSTLCMKYVRKYKYVLKCDISKFYPSINHNILKQIIRMKIKDKRLLILLDDIIDSLDGETNIPIGNYVSQWFGNLYLNELDELVKHKLKVVPYIRYCDDFVLFSNDKKDLHNWLAIIEEYLLNNLKLKMSKKNIFPVFQGIDFLGYRHFKNKILLRKRTAKRTKKKVKELMHLLKSNRITKEQALGKIDSANGLIVHGQCYNLSQSLNINNIRNEIIQYEAI